MTSRKPPFSAWLEEQREARGWKQEEVARRLRDAGHEANDSTYRTWESSRRPKAGTVRAIEQLFGVAAPRVDAAPPAEVSELAAAIRDQTGAITDLVAELRLARQAAQPDLAEVIARAVEATLRASGARAG